MNYSTSFAASFVSKYAAHMAGVLSGFDRVVFRGHMRRLCFVQGMQAYLYLHKLLLKDFGAHAQQVTDRIRQASVARAQALGRPVQYIASPKASKEEIARRIAREQPVAGGEGTVCILTSVEPCHGFEVYRNRNEKRLELVSRTRKCLHLYHYFLHPTFGFMNARIQTWFPFSIQVCINGREWLARQMDAEGVGYVREDNCFVALSDFERAQALMNEQLRVNWAALLNRLVSELNPLHEELFGGFCTGDGNGYYWSCHQSEWATDVVFSHPAVLRRLYPLLLRHGMTALASPDVMRFLGRRIGREGRVPSAFAGEVVSDIKTRPEGVRIKHRMNHNSLKVYDKAYTDESAVLRAEMTMNDEADFRVFRPKEGDKEKEDKEADPQGAAGAAGAQSAECQCRKPGDNGDKQWRTLRRGVADMHRRAEVCQAANERYLTALSSVDDSATLEALLEPVCAPVTWNGKRVRALHPFEPEDANLLAAISRGEFAINGIRNRDLQRLLYPCPDPAAKDVPLTLEEARRRSGRITRKLRMLRAHGILSKVPHTHRYQLTAFGRQLTTAILTARQTPVRQLLPQGA